MFPMVLLMIGLLALYLFMIKPQRKEQARRDSMLTALKKNDRVLTAGAFTAWSRTSIARPTR